MTSQTPMVGFCSCGVHQETMAPRGREELSSRRHELRVMRPIKYKLSVLHVLLACSVFRSWLPFLLLAGCFLPDCTVALLLVSLFDEQGSHVRMIVKTRNVFYRRGKACDDFEVAGKLLLGVLVTQILQPKKNTPLNLFKFLLHKCISNGNAAIL